MSERKVLNKYYPPDFDPSKIPRLKRAKNRQFNIRIMAPFNMRCNSCGEYIYKGKKFNSRQETVEDEDYLGLRIFRFYIKCPRCVSEITFKTDPEKTDYSLEGGATRNFEAAKTAELLAQKALKEKEEDELNNPMKVLENRTEASRHEMDMLETLQDLKELNTRNARLEHNQLIQLHTAYTENLQRLQADEDEAFVQSLFGKSGEDTTGSIKRLCDEDSEGEDNDDDGSGHTVTEAGQDKHSSDDSAVKRVKMTAKPTSILTESTTPAVEKTSTTKAGSSWKKSIGGLSSKSSLSMLVKRKPREGVEKNMPSVLSTDCGDGTTSGTATGAIGGTSMGLASGSTTVVTSGVSNGTESKTSTGLSSGTATATTVGTSKGTNSATVTGTDLETTSRTPTLTTKGTNSGTVTGTDMGSTSGTASGTISTTAETTITTGSTVGASALGMLGCYSDSENSNSD